MRHQIGHVFQLLFLLTFRAINWIFNALRSIIWLCCRNLEIDKSIASQCLGTPIG